MVTELLEQGSVLDERQDDIVLTNSETAERYFALVRRALPTVLKCLAAHGTPQLDKKIYEGSVVSDMIQRLLFDIQALELKYAFKSDEDLQNRLGVELAASGFPAYVDLDRIGADLLHRDITLSEMRLNEEQIKKLILDRMFEEKREPRVLLAELAERSYLEMIDSSKVFLPFTPGQLIPWQTNEKGVRGYLYSWGCYGVALDCPYVHLMYFTQDESEIPFEKQGDNLAAFLRVVAEEGAHVPEKLYILGKSIDEKVEHIHPKVLKRVRIGPLVAPMLTSARSEESLKDYEVALKGMFDRMMSEDDFACLFSEEMVFSVKQTTTTKYIFKQIVQEVFYVPDLEDERDVIRYLLMPHRFYQEMLPEEAQHLPHFAKRVKFGYDAKDNVHEIS